MSPRVRLLVGFGLAVAALATCLYIPASRWWNDKLHVEALAAADLDTETSGYGDLSKFEDALVYNQLLASGAQPQDGGIENVPGYLDQLSAPDGQMGRIIIDKIAVDLPIYHTSDHDVLQKGVGHMQETSLPVGGQGTHAALTAHRGLAESLLFTRLDEVIPGDEFILKTQGETLVYRVFDTRIVKPEETQWLIHDDTRDLVTLITCDPIGLNTDRMLVTGERVLPPPPEAIERAAQPPVIPFPWFLVYGGVTLFALGVFTWWRWVVLGVPAQVQRVCPGSTKPFKVPNFEGVTPIHRPKHLREESYV